MRASQPQRLPKRAAGRRLGGHGEERRERRERREELEEPLEPLERPKEPEGLALGQAGRGLGNAARDRAPPRRRRHRRPPCCSLGSTVCTITPMTLKP